MDSPFSNPITLEEIVTVEPTKDNAEYVMDHHTKVVDGNDADPIGGTLMVHTAAVFLFHARCLGTLRRSEVSEAAEIVKWLDILRSEMTDIINAEISHLSITANKDVPTHE